MPRGLPVRALGALVAICIVWAANAILLRYAIGHHGLPPVHVAAGRFVIAALLLSPLLLRPPEGWGRILAVGLAIGACHFGFLMAGYARVTATTAAVILQLAIPTTAVLSMLTGTETPSARKLGLVLAATAMILVAIGRPDAVDPLGAAYVAVAALALAIGSVLMRGTGRAGALTVQAWVALTAAVVLSAIAGAAEPGGLAALAAAPGLAAVSIVGPAVVVTIGAHTAYYHLLQRYDPSLVSATTLLFPALTIVFGAAILAEPLGLRFVLATGGALACLAGLVVGRRPAVPDAAAPTLRP